MAGLRTASLRLDPASDGTMALDGTITARAHGFPDGRHVLLTTDLATLVPGDTQGTMDLFLVDVVTSAVARISQAADGTPADAISYPVNSPISPDGTAALFTSTATNLVPGSTDTRGLYVFNLATGTNSRIDATAAGTAANGDSYSVDHAFSPDSKSVLFISDATNLVPGDTNGVGDLFVKNLVTGAITRVNTAADGTQSTYPWIANPFFFPDSTRVLFESTVRTLVPDDTDRIADIFAADIFVKDLITGAITRVNAAADGTPANGEMYLGVNTPRVSADGTQVLFASPASNLVPNDTNGEWDLFLKNLATGAITRVNTAADGSQAQGDPYYLYQFLLSDDGTHVLFTSEAGNLVPGDTNATLDFFLKNLTTGAITRHDAITPEILTLLGSGADALFPPSNGTAVGAQPLLKDLRAGATPGTNFSITVWRDYPQSHPGATSFIVTAARSGFANPAETIAWSVAGTGSKPADAADFAGTALPAGTLDFAAGQVQQSFTLHIAHNSIAEAVESYAITLASAADETPRGRFTGTIVTSDPALELVAIVPDSSTRTDETAFEAYPGPVAGIERQWLRDDPHGTSISTFSPNWFIHTGSGDDYIHAHSGRNVLDGGGGSNFLIGGAGADTFFVHAGLSNDPTWATIAAFGQGDDTTLWGIDPALFTLDWFDDLGAPGYTGLTLLASRPGTATTALTFAGYTKADLDTGTLSHAFGFDPASGSHYLHIARI